MTFDCCVLQYGGDGPLGAVDQTDQTVAHYAARTGNTMVTIRIIKSASLCSAQNNINS